jgi:hypothetical protein
LIFLTVSSWSWFIVKWKVLLNLIALAPTAEENLLRWFSVCHFAGLACRKSLGTDGGKKLLQKIKEIRIIYLN